MINSPKNLVLRHPQLDKLRVSAVTLVLLFKIVVGMSVVDLVYTVCNGEAEMGSALYFTFVQTRFTHPRSYICPTSHVYASHFLICSWIYTG